MKMTITDMSISYDSNQAIAELKGIVQNFDDMRGLQGQEVEIKPVLRTAGLSQIIPSPDIRVNPNGDMIVTYTSTDNSEIVTYRMNPDGTMSPVAESDERVDNTVVDKYGQSAEGDDYAYKKSINACITWLLKHRCDKPIIICRNDREFLCGEQNVILAMDKDFTEYKGLYRY